MKSPVKLVSFLTLEQRPEGNRVVSVGHKVTHAVAEVLAGDFRDDKTGASRTTIVLGIASIDGTDTAIGRAEVPLSSAVPSPSPVKPSEGL